jgi:hypothetical protein
VAQREHSTASARGAQISQIRDFHSHATQVTAQLARILGSSYKFCLF